MALALELTDSALAKVGPTDTAQNPRMPVGYWHGVDDRVVAGLAKTCRVARG